MDKRIKDLLKLLGETEVPEGYEAIACDQHGAYLYRHDVSSECPYCSFSKNE